MYYHFNEVTMIYFIIYLAIIFSGFLYGFFVIKKYYDKKLEAIYKTNNELMQAIAELQRGK